MNQKPLPPPPVRFPSRTPPAHVQAAVAQAKIQAPPVPRGPAPHVQAAIAQAAQARLPRQEPQKAPPPVARAPQVRPPQSVQAKAPAPVRPPAPHVQRASAPPVPPAPARVPVVQPMKRPFVIKDEDEDEQLFKKMKIGKEIPLFDFSDLGSFDFNFSFPSLTTSSPLLQLPPLLTIPSFTPSFIPSFTPTFIPSFTPIFTPSFTPSLSLPTSQSIVKTYDPTTEELSELAQSAQNLFAYKDTEDLIGQRTVKLFDVSNLTFDKRSTATVHAAVQIDDLNPMIVRSGEYGTSTKVVRDWMEKLTWKDKLGLTQTGFVAPSIKDKHIKFTIPKKESGHRWSAHAEVNAYRELYKLYQNHQLTPSSLAKFRMATNIAHCAECWWAAIALFQKLGIDTGKIETSSPTQNVLFKQWTEPWNDFYKELGLGSSPFRNKEGGLLKTFKKNKSADPKELNKLQNVVVFK